MSGRQKNFGFTIVELLIVIVVIAILAAIVIVAYNGIQNRANDSAVQSDLRTIGQQAMTVLVDTGVPPDASDTAALSAIIKPTKGSYMQRSAISFVYCTAPDRFALVAMSKSGNVYVFHSQNGAVYQGGNWGGSGSSGSCTNPNTTNDSAFSSLPPSTRQIVLDGDGWAAWVL